MQVILDREDLSFSTLGHIKTLFNQLSKYCLQFDIAGTNRVARYRIMGHAGKDINEKVYTHKDIEELRKAIEMI